MSNIYRYCAWCPNAKPVTRQPGVFYTSTICQKHLAKLRKETMGIAKTEATHLPKPEVVTSIIETENATETSIGTVIASAAIVP